jgi:hypothetical protein
MADDKGFGSGAIHNSDRLVADHQNYEYNSNVVDGEMLQLAAELPTFPSHRSVTYQASPMQLNSEITQGSASYDNLDVTKKAEDEGIDVFADDEDDSDTYTIRRSGSSAVPGDDPASDSNISLFERRGDQHDSTQPPQTDPAVASLEQSDLTNGPLPRHRRPRHDTKDARRKRLRMRAPTGPARTASPISSALESNDFERARLGARIVAPVKEREIRGGDQEMADYGGSDDSNDEDYDDVYDTATSEIQHPPHSRKRFKQAKDTEHNVVENSSTHSLNVSCKAIPATPSVSVPESEEIPIVGHLTLKSINSKVVYCLTFSQELLLESGGASQRQGFPSVISSSSDRKDLEELSLQEQTKSRPFRYSRFSP